MGGNAHRKETNNARNITVYSHCNCSDTDSWQQEDVEVNYVYASLRTRKMVNEE